MKLRTKEVYYKDLDILDTENANAHFKQNYIPIILSYEDAQEQ